MFVELIQTNLNSRTVKEVEHQFDTCYLPRINIFNNIEVCLDKMIEEVKLMSWKWLRIQSMRICCYFVASSSVIWGWFGLDLRLIRLMYCAEFCLLLQFVGIHYLSSWVVCVSSELRIWVVLPMLMATGLFPICETPFGNLIVLHLFLFWCFCLGILWVDLLSYCFSPCA